MAAVDGQDGKQYECPRCSKVFSSLAALNGHSGMCKGAKAKEDTTVAPERVAPVAPAPAPAPAVVKEAQLDPDADDDDDVEDDENDMPLIIVALVLVFAFVVAGIMVFWDSLRELFRRPPQMSMGGNTYG